MRRALLHLAVVAQALAIAAWVLPGVTIASLPALVLGAVALAVVNAVIRPVLVFFTLPLTCLTLGLFLLVVNGVAFGLAAWLVPGFSVTSLGWAIAGALVVTLISTFLSGVHERQDKRPES